ncbi:hypothetical protein [Melittangium boletus]|uniref:hypothetical protein n=1 Tax=Melittangium boletus TaxID=83453 RepID=UPI003DA38299
MGGALLGLLGGSAAWGQGQAVLPEETPRWRATVEANTDLPLSVGGRLGIESPWHRLGLSTSLGYQPLAYVRAINSAAVLVGAYDRNAADLIEDTLQGSVVWRTHVSWRPVARAGLYVEAGYGRVTLGGNTRPESLLASLTGLEAPSDGGADGRDYHLRTVLHLLDVEVGWRWRLGGGWTARTGLGGALALDASSKVEPRFTPTDGEAVATFSREAEAVLDRTFERAMRLPVLSFSVGYAF